MESPHRRVPELAAPFALGCEQVAERVPKPPPKPLQEPPVAWLLRRQKWPPEEVDVVPKQLA